MEGTRRQSCNREYKRWRQQEDRAATGNTKGGGNKKTELQQGIQKVKATRRQSSSREYKRWRQQEDRAAAGNTKNRQEQEARAAVGNATVFV